MPGTTENIFRKTALEFREILLLEVKLIRRRQSSGLLSLSSERDLNKNTYNWKQSIWFSGSVYVAFPLRKKDYIPIALRHIYANYISILKQITSEYFIAVKEERCVTHTDAKHLSTYNFVILTLVTENIFKFLCVA